ncbi:hypothetical protein HPB47_009274 [Ixodes persulcatus]|uniref:Uncharacterized protein n=1 Tax=Ixodes persulcatus TaxID=34615 RepID=A0AC60P2R4_IXOPE|nr:hypothetical protein HPB47_009274 [Ixodes persulcatus]
MQKVTAIESNLQTLFTTSTPATAINSPFFVNTFAHSHVHRTYSYSRKRTILRSPFPDITLHRCKTPPTESPRSPLVIGGDFNLPHTGWGYKHCSAAGRNLWQDSTISASLSSTNPNFPHALVTSPRETRRPTSTSVTDPTFPTRLGTSTARDTTPDLTFTKNVVNAQWRNTQYDLGSDHSIIKITLPHLTALSTRTRVFAFVDWDAFRKHRTEKAVDTSITNIESWSRDLQSDTQLDTRTIKTDAPTERMDSRLAHVIEAKTRPSSPGLTDHTGGPRTLPSMRLQRGRVTRCPAQIEQPFQPQARTASPTKL